MEQQRRKQGEVEGLPLGCACVVGVEVVVYGGCGLPVSVSPLHRLLGGG